MGERKKIEKGSEKWYHKREEGIEKENSKEDQREG